MCYVYIKRHQRFDLLCFPRDLEKQQREWEKKNRNFPFKFSFRRHNRFNHAEGIHKQHSYGWRHLNLRHWHLFNLLLLLCYCCVRSILASNFTVEATNIRPICIIRKWEHMILAVHMYIQQQYVPLRCWDLIFHLHTNHSHKHSNNIYNSYINSIDRRIANRLWSESLVWYFSSSHFVIALSLRSFFISRQSIPCDAIAASFSLSLCLFLSYFRAPSLRLYLFWLCQSINSTRSAEQSSSSPIV